MDLYPAARRVLLTAYADTGAAIDAINVVDLDYYLLKPWDPPEEKLYPVIDAQLEAWARDRPPAGPRDEGRRATAGRPARPRCASSSPATRCRTAGTRPRRRRARACSTRPAPTTADAAAGRHRRTAPRSPRRPTPNWPAHVGLTTDAGRGLLRPDRHRRRAGRSRLRGVRRVRGAADRARRADGHRRAGRAELADRELPRLPRRRVRRPAHRAGPAAGGQVRRRADHHSRRGRRWR